MQALVRIRAVTSLEPLRSDPALFAQAAIENGTVVWPNGADLCPDVLIWGGLPPK